MYSVAVQDTSKPESSWAETVKVQKAYSYVYMAWYWDMGTKLHFHVWSVLNIMSLTHIICCVNLKWLTCCKLLCTCIMLHGEQKQSVAKLLPCNHTHISCYASNYKCDYIYFLCMGAMHSPWSHISSRTKWWNLSFPFRMSKQITEMYIFSAFILGTKHKKHWLPNKITFIPTFTKACQSSLF
jgi:hypothetical protein